MSVPFHPKALLLTEVLTGRLVSIDYRLITGLRVVAGVLGHLKHVNLRDVG
jgi:hypothetical protein